MYLCINENRQKKTHELKTTDLQWVLGFTRRSSTPFSKSYAGVTVFLCGMAIAVLGSHCHAPTVMLANFVATPIELSLMIPFLRLGEIVTGGPKFPLTSDALKKVLTGQASVQVLDSILRALLGWLVAAPFILTMLHVVLLPCFQMLVNSLGTGLSSPKKRLLSPS